MANETDTDRLAAELLSALRGTGTGPVAGARRTGALSQQDERSMLGTIKEFLNQSLPGGKEKEQPSAPATSQGGSVGFNAPAPIAGAESVDWQTMYQRQEVEREAMYARHGDERSAMQQRHVKEMESFAGIRKEVTRPSFTRPSTPSAPKPALSARRSGIVPGKTVGEWAVETENGTKTFMAVSEDQALREARRYGLTPTSARLSGIHTYTADELERMRSSFGVPGMRESMEAEFEQAIKMGLIPENSQFERLPNREWGYRVGSNPVVRKGSDLVPKRGF